MLYDIGTEPPLRPRFHAESSVGRTAEPELNPLNRYDNSNGLDVLEQRVQHLEEGVVV